MTATPSGEAVADQFERIHRELISIHAGLAEEPGDLQTSRWALTQLMTLINEVHGMIEGQRRRGAHRTVRQA